MQIIALCDGWVATSPNGSDRVKGNTFPVDAEKLNLTVEMERSYRIDVVVKDLDGKPVSDVKFGCSPNHQLLLGGSTILGNPVGSSLNNVLRRLGLHDAGYQRPDSKQPTENWFMQFFGDTDEKGQATLTNMPKLEMDLEFLSKSGKPEMRRIPWEKADGASGRLKIEVTLNERASISPKSQDK